MKNQLFVAAIAYFLVLFGGCKEKEKETETKLFISAPSIIDGQVKDIDTSLYSIIKINYRDSISSDTEYIPREDFRLLAKDFLDMPELSPKKYVEENIPGPTDGLSTVSYRPIDPTREEIQRVDFIIDPTLAETGKSVVKTIYIDRGFLNKDSSVQKRLLWQMDKSFQVAITRQLPGKPETNTTFRVIWNDEENP
jgi:hypothetical protein